MKKLLLLPFVLILICGCAHKTTILPQLNNISCIMNFSFDDEKYIAQATLVNDVLNLTIEEPKNIKGLTIKMDKNGFTGHFNDVSRTFEANCLPQNAIFQILFNIIVEIKDKPLNCYEENCKIIGETRGYNYIFTFSPSGLPLKLQIDQLNLTINFNNVNLK